MSDSFLVRFAETREAKERLAATFIDPAYLETYGTTPPLSDAYAVIERDGVVCACMGIELPGDDGQVSIMRIYQLTWNALPVPVQGDNCMQYGRWVSNDPAAGTLAIHAATLYALGRGKVYGFVEHDRRVHRRTVQLGIAFWDIPGARLNPALVPAPNRPYYAAATMGVYLVDLPQVATTLRRRLPANIAYAR